MKNQQNPPKSWKFNKKSLKFYTVFVAEKLSFFISIFIVATEGCLLQVRRRGA